MQNLSLALRVTSRVVVIHGRSVFEFKPTGDKSYPNGCS
jgi:hypothetical protein